MKPYIYGKRNEIHIVDIRETLRGLLRAKKLIAHAVSRGGDVLFVGTKRQAREIVQEQAEHCKMHFVCERWLGGTLTNFRTIRSRLQRLEELERSPEWETDYSKKMKSMLSRELKKIRTNLQGIRNMNRLPGALVVIDVRKEHNAVREARALQIPTIAMVDTDGDPDCVDVVIPGNDDAMRSIQVVIHQLANAVEEAMKARPEPTHVEATQEVTDYAAPPPRRRGRRSPPPPRPAPGPRVAVEHEAATSGPSDSAPLPPVGPGEESPGADANAGSEPPAPA
jgi:small subunit ribosomal protein S2